MSGHDFDDHKKYLDGKIKDNNGKPREGGGNNRPDKTLSELDGNGARVEAATVDLENFDGMDYEYIHTQMIPVSEDASRGYQDALHGVKKNIQDGLQKIKDAISTLDQAGGWKGTTHDAAMADLKLSYVEPDEASKAAFALGTLSEYYSQIMSTNKHNILDQWDAYQDSLESYPDDEDEVRRYFNNFAQDVMKNYYSPEIKDLAAHQPGVDWQQPAATTPLSPAYRMDMPGEHGGNGKDDKDDGGYKDGYEDGYKDGQKDKGGNDFGGGNGGANGSGGGHGSGGGSGDGGGSGNGSGAGQNGSGGGAPAFSPPNIKASTPGGGASGGGSNGSGGGSNGSGSGSNGSGGGSGDAPKPSFNPPALGQVKSPGGADGDDSSSNGGSGNGSSGSGAPKPGSSVPGAQSPHFDPSKVLTDPKSLAAAHQLLDNPKTAEAAKKLLSDPKLADAAKTLFGESGQGKQGLLGNPKALEAAKTLFGNPEAADAAKALFGDPDTAKAAQQLLNDPHLKDLGNSLKDSIGTPHLPGDLTDSSSSNGVRDVSRSVASPAGLSSAGLVPGLAAGALGGSSDGQSFLSGIMDGVGQIVQTAQQGAAPQAPNFGGPGFDGAPGGPGDPAGAHAGAGHGGGGGGAGAGPGKLHMAGAGAPIAANLTHAAHAGALTPATDGSQAGAAGGGGAPPGGGHGGGGRGGEGKDHKGNKALRGSGNGQDLIGDPDAVVAVIGDDSSGGPGWSADS